MAFNFGSTAAAAPAASTGFSFGANPSTPAPAAGGGGGFSFGGGGAAAAPTVAAPATGGGFSFGAAPSAAATGGSFGFGSGATTAAAPATTTMSLFGGGAAAGGGGASLFGSGAAKPTTSLFGGAGQQATTTGGFGGLGGFGGGFSTNPLQQQQQQQLQQQQQQQQQQQPAITLETVFDTLPADVKKNVTDFHQFLKDQDQSDAFLKSVSPSKHHELVQNLQQLDQDVLVRRNLQDRQATCVHHVRKDVKHLITQVDRATLNLRSMSGESTSQKFYGIMRRVEMPSPYYWELLDNFEARMDQIKTQIQNVESEFQPLYEKQSHHHQRGVTASLSEMDPAMLHQILISQNNAMIQIAAHVAEVHEKTEEMRQLFIRKMKDELVRHGDKNLATFKNPFDKKNKNSATHDSDIDNIRFKTSVAPTIVAATQPQPFNLQQQQQPATIGGGFGFNTGGFATTATPAAAGTSSLFAPATTTTTGATGGLFTMAPAATPATTGFSLTGGASSFSTSAAPKQVSFSLGGTASAVPSISTAPPTAAGGFGFGSAAAPAAGGAGGFGSVTSSFLPAAATPAFGAGDKRAAAGGSGGLRTRQRKGR